jgi:acylphosphatase
MFKDREVIRQYIRFYGWVQAVGFRWRAMQAAEHYGATGWVRNKYDDSVSMEIQGTQKQIDDVIAALERGRYIRIDRMEVKSLAVDPEERGFRVKYH